MPTKEELRDVVRREAKPEYDSSRAECKMSEKSQRRWERFLFWLGKLINNRRER